MEKYNSLHFDTNFDAWPDQMIDSFDTYFECPIQISQELFGGSLMMSEAKNCDDFELIIGFNIKSILLDRSELNDCISAFIQKRNQMDRIIKKYLLDHSVTATLKDLLYKGMLYISIYRGASSDTQFKDYNVRIVKSPLFNQSVTATWNAPLYERLILRDTYSQSYIQKSKEPQYHRIKHISICNFKLEHLANRRKGYCPGNFYTEKSENQTIRIGISVWILTLDPFLYNNRKMIYIQDLIQDLREWFPDLKKRKHFFRPLHKKKQISSLEQKESITQDNYAKDEKVCQLNITCVYCVYCLSILDVGNRIIQMGRDST